ncbi:MAG TPA: metallophosphoesterase [Candidatus Hydrothermia bacterium]|nr:metallophosphoesterase [Candidatus Hydrothermae bacterium]MDD3649257.1 metallophosphoesterase [Candidatus Hydrothermia bacterium]HOK22671.1 metallophosphoesterase [Candidatus Hydrothermia bacterium]HOL23380.1 metallophosphoesterase [Candidatus Hydrothermia bacterium]HPO78436.1 metallophosphoesterase [Candidatus Hydrothermia bacterium]
MWLLLITLAFPVSYAKPEFSFNGDTLVVTLNTQNPSQMAKLVYGMIGDPLDFNFENYKVSKFTGTKHTFKITDINEQELYIFKAAFFDTVTKIYYATQNYTFKPKKRGNLWEEGIVVDVGPYLSMIDERSVGIAFYTNRPSKAKLFISEKGEFEDTTPLERHEFIVENLTPGTYEYYVIVYDNRDTSKTHNYKFKISDPKRTKIGVFGDTRGNGNNLNPVFYVDGVNEAIGREISKSLYQDSVDLIFVLGDLITGRSQEIEYSEEEYKSFLKACWPYISYVPFMPIPGNHDMIAPVIENDTVRYDPPPPGSAEDLWRKVFILPENGPDAPAGMPPYKENVYYINIGNTSIYVLNSDYNYVLYKTRPNPSIRLADSLQQRWLKESVRNNNKYRHRVLLFHEPLIGLGISGRGLRAPEVDTFANFLKEMGFGFYISGHDHMYARGTIFNGLVQIVSAGGGAPLYDLKRELSSSDILIHKYTKTFNYLIIEPTESGAIKITAKNLSGEILDSFKTK